MQVIFVCTGNTVRSALAESCFRRLVDERKIADLTVESAGLFADSGSPAAAAAMRVAGKRGLDLSQHRARGFDPGQLGERDLVVVMDELHRKQILRATRLSPDQVRLLASFGPDRRSEIDDPLGGPDSAYEQCMDQLSISLEGLASWLEEQRLARS